MIDLKSILKQNPSCLNSRAAFKSVLLDKYPSEKRMVNILTILFECGVASKIKAKKIISPNDMQGLLTQVENDYGISAQYSQSAILIWAAAYDITASSVNPQDTTTFSETTETVCAITPEYVEGNVDDYDVIKRDDGYYIARFNGFEEEEMTIPSIIDGKKIKGIAKEVFKGCLTVKVIRISEGIEIIEDAAFMKCKALETVSLPNTLRRIGCNTKEYGIGVFAETNLKAITIPQNVEFLGPYSFYSCSNLQKIQISDRISAIHTGTFCSCKRLSEIKLPRNLLSIGEDAFSRCTSLREIHIPVGTQEIGRNAFFCTYINSIFVPPTVTKISDGSYTFGSLSKNLTIYCSAGSVAMEYARKNNIKCAKAQF